VIENMQGQSLGQCSSFSRLNWLVPSDALFGDLVYEKLFKCMFLLLMGTCLDWRRGRDFLLFSKFS